MTDYSPKEYWAGVAENFRSADLTGFAPVLHPDAPAWYNRLIDNLQFQAMRRALAIAQIPQGARFLDIGCGTGRWLRRYKERGFGAMGMDATLGMLRTLANMESLLRSSPAMRNACHSRMYCLSCWMLLSSNTFRSLHSRERSGKCCAC